MLLQETASLPTKLHNTQTSNVNNQHSALCCIPPTPLHLQQPVPNICHDRTLCTATAYCCTEQVQEWGGVY